MNKLTGLLLLSAFGVGLNASPAVARDEIVTKSQVVRFADLSQIRAAEKMRADFVANASHELRTPLATLIGFLETLQDDEAAPDPATRRRFLQIMAEQATRMRALIDDLMSLSRIEADRYAAPDEKVDLVPLVDSVVRSLEALSLERRSSIVVEISAKSTIIDGDRAL